MSKYADKIEEMISRSTAHMTAEQIFLSMKQVYPKVVLATIYNNLNALTRDGRIRKICIEGSPDRYDKIMPHDHMVCVRCGKLTDVELTDLTGMIEEQTGEKIVSYDLLIRHICSDCRKDGIISDR